MGIISSKAAKFSNKMSAALYNEDKQLKLNNFLEK